MSCIATLPARHAVTVVLITLLAVGQTHTLAHAGDQSPVGLVTDLSGSAESASGGKKIHLVILSELTQGTRVKLFPGAKMVVLYYLSARQFAVTGPALIRVGESEVESLSGNEPVSVKAPIGKDGKPLIIRPVGVTQAGVVVRGTKPIPLISPTGRKTLVAGPIFRWTPVEPGVSYQFILKDENGNLLVKEKLQEVFFALPSNIVLAEGQQYSWSVSANGSSGISYASIHRFEIAGPETRSRVENFRPSIDALRGERVAFAIWLEQEGLADEAREAWIELIREGVELPPEKLGAIR